MDIVAAYLQHIGAAREDIGDFTVAQAHFQLPTPTQGLERIFELSIPEFCAQINGSRSCALQADIATDFPLEEASVAGTLASLYARQPAQPHRVSELHSPPSQPRPIQWAAWGASAEKKIPATLDTTPYPR
jgi:hypothetical protein